MNRGQGRRNISHGGHGGTEMKKRVHRFPRISTDSRRGSHKGTKSTEGRIQIINPEIIWIPEYNGYVIAKPVLYNNVVYTSTYSPRGEVPVELAGFAIDTGEMVFYLSFGGPEDADEKNQGVESGGVGNPIFIHEDILYFLSGTLSAWDLKTGEQLYRHIFTKGTPNHMIYPASGSLQALFYQGNIYYTSRNSDSHYGFHNIHCMEAATGKLVAVNVGR